MVKLSEAASLALHTMVLLAGRPKLQVSAREIATELDVSEAHLSKVLQKLARDGLVNSTRGPKGGFALSRRYADISLLDIYESIEGPLREKHCFRTTSVCNGDGCIFGGLLEDVNHQVREYLAETKLPALAGKIGRRRNGHHEKNNQDRRREVQRVR
ncbi:MAG: Rrf2 family transcriptional regulator [Candidatus Glassbacteria bacterium]